MASGVFTSGTISASGVAVAAGTVDGKKTEVSYFGFSIRENAGTAAPATVRIRQKDATGPILDEIELNANESAREWYGPQGRKVRDDIFVEVVAGAIEGVIFHG